MDAGACRCQRELYSNGKILPSANPGRRSSGFYFALIFHMPGETAYKCPYIGRMFRIFEEAGIPGSLCTATNFQCMKLSGLNIGIRHPVWKNSETQSRLNDAYDRFGEVHLVQLRWLAV